MAALRGWGTTGLLLLALLLRLELALLLHRPVVDSALGEPALQVRPNDADGAEARNLYQDAPVSVGH